MMEDEKRNKPLFDVQGKGGKKKKKEKKKKEESKRENQSSSIWTLADFNWTVIFC